MSDQDGAGREVGRGGRSLAQWPLELLPRTPLSGVGVRSSFLPCFSERNASDSGPSQRSVLQVQGSQAPQIPASSLVGTGAWPWWGAGVAAWPRGTGSWCYDESALHGKPDFDFRASGKAPC